MEWNKPVSLVYWNWKIFYYRMTEGSDSPCSALRKLHPVTVAAHGGQEGQSRKECSFWKPHPLLGDRGTVLGWENSADLGGSGTDYNEVLTILSHKKEKVALIPTHTTFQNILLSKKGKLKNHAYTLPPLVMYKGALDLDSQTSPHSFSLCDLRQVT